MPTDRYKTVCPKTNHWKRSSIGGRLFVLTMLLWPYLVEASVDTPLLSGNYELLVIAFAFPLLLKLHLLILVQMVHRSMYSSSSEIEDPEPEVLSRPESKTLIKPEIQLVNSASEMPVEVVEHRERMLKTSLANLWRRWRVGMIAAGLYLIIPASFNLASGREFTAEWILIPLFVAVFMLLLGFSYRANRADYQPSKRTRRMHWHPIVMYYFLIKALLKSPYDVLIVIMLNAAVLLFILIQGFSEEMDISPTLIGFVLAGIVHIGLILRVVLSNDTVPNVKLLVLRVFGKSDSAVLTFDHLLESWHYFGLHFTVDDPDLARHRYRFFQNRNYLLIFVAVVSSITFVADGYAWLYILAAVVAWDWFGLIRRWPVASGEAARARIDRAVANPRNPDGSFKDVRMPCHMNTWKLVVHEFIQTADVVLFDLREFSEINRGSEYEINFLFDTFPLDKLVLLTQTESDFEAITNMLLEQWRKLRQDSPNLNLQEPVIKVYVNDSTATADAQGLMDLLLDTGSEFNHQT